MIDDYLYEVATRPYINRKVSLEQTEECPIWDSLEGLWMESDVQFRERFKELFKQNKESK